MQVADRSAPRLDDELLVRAASFFTLAVLLHGSDHVRRGVDVISRDVFWAGTAAVSVEVLVVVLACRRHRLAPLAAVSIGASLALGYVVVHFSPSRSWLSDSLTSASDVGPLSWMAASLEVVAAVTLAAAGLAVLRRRGGLVSAAQPQSAQLPLATALRHPAVVTMVIGNLAILAVSFSQL